MRTTVRLLAVAALAAAPLALQATPAAAYCAIVPLDPVEVWTCNDRPCSGVAGPYASASHCLDDGVDCEVALPDRQLLGCD